MSEATDANAPFKKNERVKRKSGKGCQGTVQDVRTEITASTGDTSEKGWLVNVLWDNGTDSYFAPQGLERV